jgi:ParB-like chromosome segregation protein Spo0J
MGNSLIGNALVEQVRELVQQIAQLPEDEAVEVLNEIKIMLHEVSPHKDEPVDCVLWVKAEQVHANDYNPNKVAPPEMKLLEISIDEDGYTQPVVTFPESGGYTVVDGFHRHRVGKESKKVQKRVKGYLPITLVRSDREDYADRIASTIRHNRARGKHQIQAMSEVVQELARRNWTDAKIGRELGMDADEVLRLKQISGLAEMFADREFSEAWALVDEESPSTS